MQKINRVLSVFLCVTLLFLSVLVPVSFAEASQGRIVTQSGGPVYLRKTASTDSEILDSIPSSTVVTINGKVDGENYDAEYGTIWYNVTYGAKTGYVYGKYVKEIAPSAYDPDFEKNLLNFPESYREALRNIHNAYPNWVFIADNLGISLDTAINYEYSATEVTQTRKWVELTYGLEWRDPRADKDNPDHLRDYGRWIFASREAIAFFMDPRNALTVTNTKSSFPNIFTFLQQSYDKNTQNESGLRTIVANTFLANGYDNDTDAYIKDIMAAAEQSNVSPYVIATTIIAEQGVNGGSSLISGTYAGYEGFYNFFNYGASNGDIIKNGLEYAKSQNWNSRRASIIGGAKLYENGYLSANQDTYYYMDFNVKEPNRMWHQYANSLYDQCIKAVNMRKACASNANATLTFKIPVYSSMPDAVYAAPTIDNYGGGSTTEPENPTPVDPTPTRRKGDYDGDGQITVLELAVIRMYLLGIKSLSAEERGWLDVNADNEITVQDLAMVRMYLLGLISI